MASQAMVFFFGGFDTVSTLMSFLCYEMAANPDIQQKLRDEVEETFAACDRNLTYDALNKMKYLDMVVSGKYTFDIRFLSTGRKYIE